MNTIDHPRSRPVIDFAYRYADMAHGSIGQVRRFTGEPYIVHATAVAHIIASVSTDFELISAAYLHDVDEDTPYSVHDINEAGFRFGIAQLVYEVTNPSKAHHGNRATRKAMDIAHLANATERGQTLKLADIIENCPSIIEHDPDFARTYIREKSAQLEVLHRGHPALYKKAKQIIDDYYSPVTVQTANHVVND